MFGQLLPDSYTAASSINRLLLMTHTARVTMGVLILHQSVVKEQITEICFSILARFDLVYCP